MDRMPQMNASRFRDVYQRFLPMVYRIAFTYMKNPQDSEDAAQETFLRLLRQEKPFHSEKHCKAWLIVTVGNVCKDLLRRRRHTEIPLEDCLQLPAVPEKDRELLWVILELPVHDRAAVYLYYYEGYTIKEMAQLLEQNPETVKSRLRRARAKLKERLGESFDG